MIREQYVREYIHDEWNCTSGLTFGVTESGYFTVDARMNGASKVGAARAVLTNCAIQQTFSDRTNSYIEGEFRRILTGEPSEWRIVTIKPYPNGVSIEMSHPTLWEDESNCTVEWEIADEIRRLCKAVTLCISANNISQINLTLQHCDLSSSEIIYYIRIILWLKTNLHGRRPWSGERISVAVEYPNSNKRRNWDLSWKDADRINMIAKIDEVS